MPSQRALAGEILARFERRGLELRAAKLAHVDRELAEQHYAEHREKPFFGELVEFITSAPTLALVLEGEGAIASVRTTMGATNPVDVGARARSAATSRSRCRTTSCTARTRPSRPAREIALWFPDDAPLTDGAPQSRVLGPRGGRVPGRARRAHRHGQIRWGLWQIPESELGILGDVAGKDVLELGCGAAQWSILLARQGARVVGLDNS